MKSITLVDNEIILINGKLYLAQENLLANDNSFRLECIDSVINDELRQEILTKECNDKSINIDMISLEYRKFLKD